MKQVLKSEVEEYLDYDYDEYLLSLNTRNASNKNFLKTFL